MSTERKITMKDLVTQAKLLDKKIDQTIVENIQHILSSCYDCLLSEFPTPEKTTEIIGTLESHKWQLFLLGVIAELKKDGCFGETSMENFEDTANGCDELIWDAACRLLTKLK